MVDLQNTDLLKTKVFWPHSKFFCSLFLITYAVMPIIMLSCVPVFRFKLFYTVTIKGDGLVTQLSVQNLNGILCNSCMKCNFFLASDPFSFTWLLHTYFSVPDVTKVTISGLGGLTYIDKVSKKIMCSYDYNVQVDGGQEKQEKIDYVTISGFTDRYLCKMSLKIIIEAG